MSKKFNYDYNNNHYENIMSYIYNKDYWNERDIKLYDSLDIDEGQSIFVGSNRKKIKIFYDKLKFLESF